MEIDFVIQEIKVMLMNIKEWSATEKVTIIFGYDYFNICIYMYKFTVNMNIYIYILQLFAIF